MQHIGQHLADLLQTRRYLADHDVPHFFRHTTGHIRINKPWANRIDCDPFTGCSRQAVLVRPITPALMQHSWLAQHSQANSPMKY